MDSQASTILNNIFSLLSELKQMEGGGETSTEAPTSPPVQSEVKEDLTQTGTEPEDKRLKDEGGKMDENKKDEKKEVDKSLITSDTEGTPADEGMKERIEDVNTDITDETVDEIAKALVQKLLNRSVKKSVKVDPVNKQIAALTQVVKSLTDKVVEQDQAMTKVLKGLGLGDEIINKYSLQKVDTIQKGLNNVADVNKSLEYIANFIQKNNQQKTEDDPKSQMNEVRKNLDGDFVNGLLNLSKSKR